jgi:hypothetical protein
MLIQDSMNMMKKLDWLIIAQSRDLHGEIRSRHDQEREKEPQEIR